MHQKMKIFIDCSFYFALVHAILNFARHEAYEFIWLNSKFLMVSGLESSAGLYKFLRRLSVQGK